MKKTTFKFLTVLLVVLAVVFAGHLLILQNMELPIFADRIVLSYLLNYALAASILIFIQSKFNKKSSHTGFIFLAGSGIKFLVFFLVFYPFYREDGTMSSLEFAAFFVPYATCLVSEVAFLSKQLNNQDS
jgi:hypothetical protein